MRGVRDILGLPIQNPFASAPVPHASAEGRLPDGFVVETSYGGATNPGLPPGFEVEIRSGGGTASEVPRSTAPNPDHNPVGDDALVQSLRAYVGQVQQEQATERELAAAFGQYVDRVNLRQRSPDGFLTGAPARNGWQEGWGVLPRSVYPSTRTAVLDKAREFFNGGGLSADEAVARAATVLDLVQAVNPNSYAEHWLPQTGLVLTLADAERGEYLGGGFWAERLRKQHGTDGPYPTTTASFSRDLSGFGGRYQHQAYPHPPFPDELYAHGFQHRGPR